MSGLRVEVRCNNSECDDYNEVRSTQFPTLPGGFFLEGTVLCKCGFPVQTIRREEARKQGWI